MREEGKRDQREPREEKGGRKEGGGGRKELKGEGNAKGGVRREEG